MQNGKVNSMNVTFLSELLEALREARTQGRPLVLASASPSTFSAGLDLVELFDCDKDQSARRTDRALGLLSQCVLALFQSPFPTVAAIGGHAIAGGAVISLACDWRVACATSAKSKLQFGATEVLVGVPFPAFAFATMLSVPLPHRNDATLFGKKYSAEEGHAAGIFRELVQTPEEVLDRAVEVATTLAESSLPAFALAKEQMTAHQVNYIKTNEDRIMKERVLPHLYSELGWNHVQQTLTALKRR